MLVGSFEGFGVESFLPLVGGGSGMVVGCVV